MGRPISLGAALLATACHPLEPQVIGGNATWADDETAVLLVETRYQSPDPDVPWFSDGDGESWEIAFLSADADLGGAEELCVVPDPAQTLGGGALHAPLWWLADAGLAVIQLYDEVVVVDLGTATLHRPVLPDGLAASWFGFDIEDERGLVSGYAPSPDGRTLAVLYSLAWLAPDDAPYDPVRFRHGLAFYDLDADGAWLGGRALDPWTDTWSSLKLDPPAAELPVEIPEPPAISPWRSLQQPARFLWDEAGAGVFVVDRGTEEGEESSAAWIPVAEPEALRLLGAEEVVPAVPLPTSGGPVRSDGRALVAWEEDTAPNEATVEVLDTEGWVGFADRGEVAVDSVAYGY